jgi:hypothetical protein
LHVVVSIMTAMTLHVDHERVRLTAWTAVVMALMMLFAMAARSFWDTQPLALLVLLALFAGVLVLLVAVADRLAIPSSPGAGSGTRLAASAVPFEDRRVRSSNYRKRPSFAIRRRTVAR